MPDYATIKLDDAHELVWFEDLSEWRMRWRSAAGLTEVYSAQGWDTKSEGTRAFEQGGLTWTAAVPGARS